MEEVAAMWYVGRRFQCAAVREKNDEKATWQATFSVWPLRCHSNCASSRMATLSSMAQYGLGLKTMKLPC